VQGRPAASTNVTWGCDIGIVVCAPAKAEASAKAAMSHFLSIFAFSSGWCENYRPMLEGILLTVVLVVVASYFIGGGLTRFLEWNCRRTNTPENREKQIQAALNRQKHEQELANRESSRPY
jgi:hypothetical protein